MSTRFMLPVLHVEAWTEEAEVHNPRNTKCASQENTRAFQSFEHGFLEHTGECEKGITVNVLRPTNLG